MSVTIRKARRQSQSVRAWTMLQQRRADEARMLEVAESAAGACRAQERQIAHRLASRALSGALGAGGEAETASMQVRLDLIGLSDLHHYIGNPDVLMDSVAVTAVLQAIDNLADELHLLFRRAIKAGGQA